MAGKRGKKTKAPGKRRQKNRRRGGFVQKCLVGLSGMTLVLCAASITFGFFIRGSDDSGAQFRLEVLNGTGEPGLAHQAQRGLLMRGIDVIEVGNARHFNYEESVLIARRAGVDVEELGRIIGCSNVVVQLQEEPLEDASLIIGKDYLDLHLDWDHRSDLFK
jgi:hypothetical protein